MFSFAAPILSQGVALPPTFPFIFESEFETVPFVDTVGRSLTTGGTVTRDLVRFQSGAASGLFNGAGYLTFNLTALESLNGDFEIETYIYPTALDTLGNEIFCIKPTVSSGDAELLFELTVTGEIRFLLRSLTPTVVTHFDFRSSAGVINVNTWYLVSASVVGSTATIKVNGSTVVTGTSTGVRNQTSKACLIGALLSTTVSRYFGGNIDRLRLFL
jgi:hypothetical protein